MTNEIKFAGVDAGNNSLKLWVAGSEPIAIPSVTSFYLGETTALMDMEDIPLTQLEENIDVTINSKALLFNNKRYIIGEKVLNDNLSAIELEEKSDKSHDELPAIVALAGLAIDAMKHDYDNNSIHITYDLALALPVATITQETANNHAERFIGTHEVTFHHPSGRNVKITIEIQYARTLPEAAAAAWGIVFDENGKVKKHQVEINDTILTTDMTDKTLLHFDIGGGSTEQVVTQGVKFNPRLSDGLDYGVKKTINGVIARWNRQNPLKSIDSIAEFNKIYSTSNHPRHNAIFSETQPSLLQLANKISTSIINKIDSVKDDNKHVFIYGGGAIVLKDTLSKILNNSGRMTNIVFLDNPEFANAYGLMVYACSPRFKMQKDKTLGVVKNGKG